MTELSTSMCKSASPFKKRTKHKDDHEISLIKIKPSTSSFILSRQHQNEGAISGMFDFNQTDHEIRKNHNLCSSF